MNKNILYYGRPEPLEDLIKLHAGPLNAMYDPANGDLRYIRLGENEILRRVYAAVRDHNWGTVPGVISDAHLNIRDDSFTISYRVDHKQGDIDFTWRGTLTGQPDGTINFTFDGEALSTFRRNRVGFCILHPMDCAGQDCTIEQVDRTHTDGIFPQHISPHQPFKHIRAITHEVIPGVQARVLMEGDTFEMEDQRNWTDASYKTYCTPLDLPFPVTVERGQRINQSITIQVSGDVPPAAETEIRPVITIKTAATPLPRIGLGMTHRTLMPETIERLDNLGLAHLRVDLHLNTPDLEAVLREANQQAATLRIKLEAALHLTDNAENELKALRLLLDSIGPEIAHWLIFHAGEKSTRAKWIELAREYLADYDLSARFGGGTDAFFTELNRERPPVNALDRVVYSLNPQVHAFQNIDLVETLAAQATTVESARAFSGDLPVVVSPITLRMRWNPNMTGPQPETPPGKLPPQVDVRQMSLLGAAWTLGSIKYLSESGAHSLTYYETIGWRGVMEYAEGSPDEFPSIPGGVYPLYHVLADVGEFAGGEVVTSESSQPLVVDALVLRDGGRTRVLVANMTHKPQTVTVNNINGRTAVKTLDETNAEAAMRAPDAFRADETTVQNVDGSLALELKPYAIARIDSA
jgi:D-apionolactonase